MPREEQQPQVSPESLTQSRVVIPEARQSEEIDDLDPYNLPFTD